MWIAIGLPLVVPLLVDGMCCPAFRTVMEGENVTIDCGFQTTVDGGNLLWTSAVSTNGSETDLGHIVPGDHYCGTDAIACTAHTNGSITLINVTVYDGDKRYRCLRGDEKGYQYFSDVNLTVLAKESLGHPVIQPLTESKANVYMIEEKGMIHGFEQPTCEDKEDGVLIVTCFPPPGLIVDKVYHQVHCNCTDSDGNSNSLNISVNSHAELKKNSVGVIAIIILCVIIVVLLCIVIRCIYQLLKAKKSRNPENIDVCCLTSLGKGTTGGSNHLLHQHDEEEGLNLNLNVNVVSQILVDLKVEFRDKSDEIVKLKEENQNKDMEISRLRQRLTKKEAESAGKSKDIYNLVRMNQVKDLSKKIGDEWEAVGRNLGLKEADLYKIKMNCKEEGHQEVAYQMLLKWKNKNARSATIRVLAAALKQSGRRDLHDELIAYKIETELYMVHKMLSQKQHPLLSQGEKEEKNECEKDKDEEKPKEVTAVDQVKDEKEENNECEKDKDEEKPKEVTAVDQVKACKDDVIS